MLPGTRVQVRLQLKIGLPTKSINLEISHEKQLVEQGGA
jgi:hypothetical protein